jgi:hypothetical protein
MKFILSILLTALLALAFGFYLPWWSIALASFVIAVIIYQRPLFSFLTGFAGLGLLWLILIFSINSSNHGILAPKISAIMGFGNGSGMLIVISCLAGAIVGGLAALTGSLLRRIVNIE